MVTLARTESRWRKEPFGDQLFGISSLELVELMESRDPVLLKRLGGVNKVLELLHVSSKKGVGALDVAGPTCQQRRQFFGNNRIKQASNKSFRSIVLDALRDKTLAVLIAASIVSLAIGLYKEYVLGMGEKYGWVEGLAIMMAVVIVVLVSSVNDYQKEIKFQRLYAKSEDVQIKVVRNSRETKVGIHDLVVGDIVIVEPGDIVSADGLAIESYNLACDEAQVTGESTTVWKSANSDPFLISGTKVVEGMGKFVVVAVGSNSFHGKMMQSVHEPKEDTPLQIKLNVLSEKIAELGALSALSMFVVLVTKWMLMSLLAKERSDSVDVINAIITIFIQSVTILVVAVPEGLPMAVTISLAFATSRMLEDNNLVRILSSCETMGNVTSICSDKTGTLTSNVMTVVQGRVGNIEFRNLNEVRDLHKHVGAKVKHILAEGISVNTTAFEITEQGQPNYSGSKTEVALLDLVKSFGTSYSDIRNKAKIVQVHPFSSERKTMGVVIQLDTGCHRHYVKGAPETILDQSKAYIDAEGALISFSSESTIGFQAYIQHLAGEGLRTIALAYKDCDQKSDIDQDRCGELAMIGILGIEDPVREGIPEAVLAVQQAGITVRMITGDNVSTASSVAKRCNILLPGGLVMEGSRFRSLNDDALTEIIPRLQVLARSTPHDKQRLVRKLRDMNEIVAVTGDGTNDGPALRAADVGFSMGITGTEVAKESSSIVLMDDNFVSIVKAVEWGRCINDSIRKFLQFQLTVNVSAVVISFVTALLDPHNASVFTAVQLLWINMLMDTMAALALATGRPTPNLLQRPPESRNTALITPQMWKMIAGQALFQVSTSLILMEYGTTILDVESQEMLSTIVFNVFVFMQICNEFNCRCLDGNMNIFEDFQDSGLFLSIILLSAVSQFLIVQYGSLAFGTVPLKVKHWIFSIALGCTGWAIRSGLLIIPWPSLAPNITRAVCSRERFRWQAAYNDVRNGLRVFAALRRPRNGVVQSF